jgi:hypothetical protein
MTAIVTRISSRLRSRSIRLTHITPIPLMRIIILMAARTILLLTQRWCSLLVRRRFRHRSCRCSSRELEEEEEERFWTAMQFAELGWMHVLIGL